MTQPNHYSIAIAADDAPCRLDKFLSQKIPELSRARIQSLIESGHVHCGDMPATNPSSKIKSGQIYNIAIPPIADTKIVAQSIALDIVFEDDDILVLNKPSGLVVHPAAGNPDNTLVNALLAHCGDSLSGIGGQRRPGIVHRMDKETSGVMIAAKNDAAHTHLSKQFADHSITRVYYALVWGAPNPPKGTIAGQIGRSKTDRKKMAVLRGGGKRAVTHYRTLETYGNVASMVECRLETGRTHQIRVHMTSIGNPLIGDKTYGRGRANKLTDPEIKRAIEDLNRQALHAKTLGLIHPKTGQYHEFNRDFPPELQLLAEKLRKLYYI